MHLLIVCLVIGTGISLVASLPGGKVAKVVQYVLLGAVLGLFGIDF